jgi:hypothetical protein
MTVQDFELNCTIRGVLARHWIDSNRLMFRARRGHIQVAGEFRLLGAPNDREITATVLRRVESEIRRVQSVRTVTFELTNWLRDEAGGWVCTEIAKGPERIAAAPA